MMLSPGEKLLALVFVIVILTQMFEIVIAVAGFFTLGKILFGESG